MQSVSTEDQASLSRVLATAFEHDPILRWIVPQDSDYAQFAEKFFRLQLRNSSNSYTNAEKTGVALWAGPNDRLTPIEQIVSALKTLWLLKNNLSRAYRLQEIMDGYRPKRHFLHLTHLATSPESQGSGIAKRLLQPVLSEARRAKVPVYLECSNRENLGFYRQFGFRLIDDVAITSAGNRGPVVWPMTLDH